MHSSPPSPRKKQEHETVVSRPGPPAEEKITNRPKDSRNLRPDRHLFKQSGWTGFILLPGVGLAPSLCRVPVPASREYDNLPICPFLETIQITSRPKLHCPLLSPQLILRTSFDPLATSYSFQSVFFPPPLLSSHCPKAGCIPCNIQHLRFPWQTCRWPNQRAKVNLLATLSPCWRQINCLLVLRDFAGYVVVSQFVHATFHAYIFIIAPISCLTTNAN